jgi:transposase-like protein
MPYLSQKARIQGTELDRRRKLSEEEKKAIRELYATGKYSQRQLAKQFEVSRRLIVFVLYPERLLENRKQHDSSKYYDKDKHREYMKSHRRYKQNLYLDGKVTL